MANENYNNDINASVLYCLNAPSRTRIQGHT
jgi:hypothetical protein